MAVKYNLDGIKEEMASRRSERNVVSEKLGETINSSGQPKDGFLNGLLTSFNTGKETHATKRIKLIENNVDIREGKKPKFTENNIQEVVQNNPIRGNNMTPDQSSVDRDELMYAQMSHKALKGGQSLSESLMNVSTGGVNRGGVNGGSNELIQSSTLNEGVKNVVNNYLAENFGLIVEESIKNTILDMYAVERIKDVLNEYYKPMIKNTIREVFREIKKEQQEKQKL